MFTGIIQSFGYLENLDKENNIYTIKTSLNLDDCSIGSSISCDGVCLTAIDIKKNNFDYIFKVNIGEETIKRSNLFKWNKDSKINLEKSLKVGDEISGHFVYGHIDTTLKLENIIKLDNSWDFNFSSQDHKDTSKIRKFIVEKGSITINGISLTISNITNHIFTVSVIPHTYKNTNLSILKQKDIVNIEFDYLARYIAKKND